MLGRKKSVVLALVHALDIRGVYSGMCRLGCSAGEDPKTALILALEYESRNHEVVIIANAVQIRAALPPTSGFADLAPHGRERTDGYDSSIHETSSIVRLGRRG